MFNCTWTKEISGQPRNKRLEVPRAGGLLNAFFIL